MQHACLPLQVFFYKRAQIFVGDLYGAFRGQGLGCFHDIDQITMFAGGWNKLSGGCNSYFERRGGGRGEIASVSSDFMPRGCVPQSECIRSACMTCCCLLWVHSTSGLAVRVALQTTVCLWCCG